MQVLPQSLKPVLQVFVEQELFTQAKFPVQLASSQQPPVGMHWPPQGFWSAPHMYSHLWLEPSHLPTLPACGGQSPSLQQPPAVMHEPLHPVVPPGQSKRHFRVA